jgi:potassium/chloride transporter 9
LSGLIGASRVLQAVAKDTMFGPFLEFILKGTVGDNPIAAVIFTGCLSGMVKYFLEIILREAFVQFLSGKVKGFLECNSTSIHLGM